ncbi:hypothetical protein [Mucilaginibacter flavidus]|uniref:hypothetical protein n=1 Tax=Mucilaginibacter flavidus TaxID=2949309 RepID=UPI002092F709|nr:hypothetical protein [Mucilaginibacter flavidus]
MNSKRSSVRKSIWSDTREASYKEYCDEILFVKKMTLTFDDAFVYLRSADEERFLLEISKPKATWYEIWLKLKSI